MSHRIRSILVRRPFIEVIRQNDLIERVDTKVLDDILVVDLLGSATDVYRTTPSICLTFLIDDSCIVHVVRKGFIENTLKL